MEERNNLFPVFLKLEELQTLVVGGGNVAVEKVTALLKSSPSAKITVVAGLIRNELRDIAAANPAVKLVERNFRARDLANKDLAILVTDDPSLHTRIRALARERRLLINVADTPALCDFYLGSVVTKGSIKIGISTNGKSPTLAKRLREYFEEAIPDTTEKVLDNMRQIRERIKGDFHEKVRTLNEVTSSWLAGHKNND